jgi:DNA-binding transcriptional MerR regulator
MAAPAQQLPEPERLYRIGDVSRLTDTKPFVLRFWETEFPMLQPVKAPKGHRLYRQEDIDLIRLIKRLLYQEGFTIPGARRHLSELLANGETAAGLLERPAAAVRATAAPVVVRQPGVNGGDSLFPESVPAQTAAAEQPAARPAGETDSASQLAAGHRAALLAVREELRAILTVLEA